MKTISLLHENDLPEAFTIETRCHTHPWSDHIFCSNQGNQYLNLKIHDNNHIYGYAITQIILDEATLFNIAVDPNHQRQGLAKQLIDELIKHLMARQVKTLWLEVRRSNQTAIALYDGVGFNEVSIRKNYYPSANGKEDAIIMALYLA